MILKKFVKNVRKKKSKAKGSLKNLRRSFMKKLLPLKGLLLLKGRDRLSSAGVPNRYLY